MLLRQLPSELDCTTMTTGWIGRTAKPSALIEACSEDKASFPAVWRWIQRMKQHMDSSDERAAADKQASSLSEKLDALQISAPAAANYCSKDAVTMVRDIRWLV
jgi:hypothetical protein